MMTLNLLIYNWDYKNQGYKKGNKQLPLKDPFVKRESAQNKQGQRPELG